MCIVSRCDRDLVLWMSVREHTSKACNLGKTKTLRSVDRNEIVSPTVATDGSRHLESFVEYALPSE